MTAPIKTKPVFKQYIWGGSALADKYGCAYYDFAAVTDCPGHHGHGRYQPHPTGYGCWLIEQDLWEKLGEVYRA